MLIVTGILLLLGSQETEIGNRYTHICTLYIHKHLYFCIYSGSPWLYFSLFHCASQILHFLQIKVLWQLHIKQVYWHHFSSGICSIIVSVSRFDNLCDISLLLWWPMISGLCYYCKKFWLTEDSGWCLAFFSNKVFKNTLTFFRHDTFTDLTDYIIV